MALQHRRGLNSERLAITPAEGEVIFVLDWENFTIEAKTAGFSIEYIGATDTWSAVGHGRQELERITYTKEQIDTSSLPYIKEGLRVLGGYIDEYPEDTVLPLGTCFFCRNVTSTTFQLSITEDGPIIPFDVHNQLYAPGITFAYGPDDIDGCPVGEDVAPVWIGDGVTPGGNPVAPWTVEELYDTYIRTTEEQDPLWREQNGYHSANVLDNFQHLEYDSYNKRWVNRNDMTVPGYLNVFGNTVLGSDAVDTILLLANRISTPNNLYWYCDVQDAEGVDTPYLYFDCENERIGIKTDTPAYTLDVRGDARIRDNVRIQGDELLMDNTRPFITMIPELPTDGVNFKRGLRGSVTEDDYWFVGAGSTGEDDGYLELSISDNASDDPSNDTRREKIIVRRYGGSGIPFPGNTPWGGAPVIDEAELFGIDGYTRFPNNFYVDVDTLAVDADNDKVGIGKASPTYKLDVAGSIRADSDLLVNGGDITSTATTFNLLNDTVTTLNIGGAATSIVVGDVNGTLILNSSTIRGASTTQNLFDSVATTVNFAGAATTIDIGSASGTTTINHALTVKGSSALGDGAADVHTVTGSWAVNTNDIYVEQATGNIGINKTNPAYRFDVTGSGRFTGSLNVETDLTVDGNFTVLGTTTNLDTVNLVVEDNIILINKNEAGSGVTPNAGTAGFEVERGALTNVLFLWDDAVDRWKFTNDGSTYTNLLVAGDSPTFAGATLGNITVGVTDDQTVDTTSGDLVLDSTSGEIHAKGSFIAEGNLYTYDNIVALNYDVQAGAPSENAGMRIYRGDEDSVLIRWNETDDRWESTVDGTTYLQLPNQNLDTDSAVEFDNITLDGISRYGTTLLTTTSTTADQVFDTFSASVWRTVKYVIQIEDGTDSQALEVLLTHNGTTSVITVYGSITTAASDLATFSSDISGGQCRLLVTPASATSTNFTASQNRIA